MEEMNVIRSGVLLLISVAVVQPGFLSIGTVDMSLHTLIPKSALHLNLLGNLRNKETTLLFWSGIGGKEQPVQIIATTEDLQNEIPLNVLEEMEWEITFEEVTISREKSVSVRKKVSKRSFEHEVGGKVASKAFSGTPFEVKEIPRMYLFTARFYRITDHPENTCELGIQNDRVVCVMYDTYEYKIQNPSHKLFWTILETKPGYYMFRSRNNPNMYMFYNKYNERFEVKASSTFKGDDESLFVFEFVYLYKFSPACVIKTKSNRTLALGQADLEVVEAVQQSPLFDDKTSFKFVANEIFDTEIHKTQINKSLVETEDSLSVAGGQVINYSDAKLEVEFEEEETAYTELITSNKSIEESALSFGVDLKFFEAVGVNYKYERTVTTSVEHETKKTEKRIITNTWDIEIPTQSVVKFSSTWDLSKNATLLVDVFIKIFRKEGFLAYNDKQPQAGFTETYTDMPPDLVLHILISRNKFRDANFYIEDGYVVFSDTVPAYGVTVIDTLTSAKETNKSEVYQVECIKDVLPEANVTYKDKKVKKKKKTKKPLTKLNN